MGPVILQPREIADQVAVHQGRIDAAVRACRGQLDMIAALVAAGDRPMAVDTPMERVASLTVQVEHLAVQVASLRQWWSLERLAMIAPDEEPAGQHRQTSEGVTDGG